MNNAYHIIKQLADVTDRFRQQFPYLPQAFLLVRQAAGGLIIVWLVLPEYREMGAHGPGRTGAGPRS